MEIFVIIVNGWKPLTIITKSSTLDIASALDPSLFMLYDLSGFEPQLNSSLFKGILLSTSKLSLG